MVVRTKDGGAALSVALALQEYTFKMVHAREL